MPDPEEKTLEQELGEQYDAQTEPAEPTEPTEPAEPVEPAEPTEPTEPEEPVEPQQDSEEEEAGETLPIAPLSAPTHWSADAQRMFLGVPTEAQQFLLDQHKAMEAAHTKRSQEVAPLRKTLETWNPYFQQIGTTPDLMVADLLQFEHSLRSGTPQQKLQAIQEVAKNYGVELNGNGQPEEAEASADPFAQMIEERLKPFQDTIDKLSGSVTTHQQSVHEQQVSAHMKSIATFKEAKGSDGKLTHPYFDEVERDMTFLAEAANRAGTPMDIATLYERACRVNDGVWAKLQLANEQKAKQERHQSAAKLKEKQREASGGLAGGSGGRPAKPMTLNEELSAGWDKLSAGA